MDLAIEAEDDVFDFEVRLDKHIVGRDKDLAQALIKAIKILVQRTQLPCEQWKDTCIIALQNKKLWK